MGDSLARPCVEDSTFLLQYLKASLGGNDAGSRQVVGLDGSIFAGLSFSFGRNPYTVNSPDFILPVGGSLACLQYQDSERLAGIQYQGAFGTGSKIGKLVYLAFPFETIAAEYQSEVMACVLNFFRSSTGLDQHQQLVHQPREFILYQNYPNPFSPKTTPITSISYQLPIATRVSLRIYNIAGQLVRKLVDKQQGAGDFSVHWDGKDGEGRPLQSGLYLYQMQCGGMSDANRIIIMY